MDVVHIRTQDKYRIITDERDITIPASRAASVITAAETLADDAPELLADGLDPDDLRDALAEVQ